ncbi:MAG TPA: uracil-DNA glycosylase [Terriglobia bacterium]|nr:uracil-DNA glycosylase [Terriglobia bacterium]
MDERLRQEVAAWLEFYRELGIEEFSLQPRSSQLATPTPKVEVQHSGARVQEPVKSEVAPRPPTPGPAISEPRTAVLPGVPAQALSLFEAPSPKRSESETLEQIREDLGDCHRCRLAAGRKTIVFGQGNPHAELVFVGEGPGADEDEQGLPFVGRAGQLLNRMLQFVGIKREDVYICNVVKCRPPGNRTPERDEVEACSPFLFRQLQAIRPRLICCLGAPAVRTLLGVKEGMLKIRGHFYDYGGTKALATVHPAYVLRNPREEKILREDFEKIRDFLKRR